MQFSTVFTVSRIGTFQTAIFYYSNVYNAISDWIMSKIRDSIIRDIMSGAGYDYEMSPPTD